MPRWIYMHRMLPDGRVNLCPYRDGVSHLGMVPHFFFYVCCCCYYPWIRLRYHHRHHRCCHYYLDIPPSSVLCVRWPCLTCLDWRHILPIRDHALLAPLYNIILIVYINIDNTNRKLVSIFQELNVQRTYHMFIYYKKMYGSLLTIKRLLERPAITNPHNQVKPVGNGNSSILYPQYYSLF